MSEISNWVQMDKCFCSASWGKCKNTQCYRYFGEAEKKYCEENNFNYYAVSDFQNVCDVYAKQEIKDGIFTDNHMKPYLYQYGKDEQFCYEVFMYGSTNTQTVVGLYKCRKDDMDILVEKAIIPYDEFCRSYHLITK